MSVNPDTDTPTPGQGVSGTWLHGLFDFCIPLVRHWKLLFAFGFTGGLLGTAMVLLMPESYKSKAVLLVAEDQNPSGAGALAKLAGGELGSLLSMNQSSSKLELDVLLNTDTLAMKTIEEFHLERDWKLDTTKPVTREARSEVWEKVFESKFGEEDQLIVTFRHKDPEMARRILLRHLQRVDSAWIALKKHEATRKAEFVQERIDVRLKLVESRVDSLIRFQVKNRIYDPDEQIHQTVLAISGLESQLQSAQISQALSSRTASSSSAAEQGELTSILRTKHGEFLSPSSGSATRQSLLINFSKSLPLVAEYEERNRRIRLDLAVIEGLARQAEQLKIESMRNVSILEMVDPPYVPAKRHSPVRTAMAEVVVLVFLGFGCLLSYLIEHFRSHPEDMRKLKELLKAWK